MAISVQSLHIYPVKSCGAIDLREATIASRGFEFDRNWMVVAPDGTKLTQRENPRLALVIPRLTSGSLVLEFAGVEPLEVPLNQIPSTRISVDIWGHRCLALDEGPDAARWLSSVLGKDLRLVRFDPAHVRSVDPSWVGAFPAETGFSDILPFHITAQESLDALNEMRRGEGLPHSPMNRFRPNIVISGVEPFVEDTIPALAFNEHGDKLEIVRPTSRCPIVDTDQSLGRREREGNLQILARQRNFRNFKGKPGAMFGVQAFASRGVGHTMKVGDVLTVTELSEGLPPLPRFS